jgi:hypothetical protein
MSLRPCTSTPRAAATPFATGKKACMAIANANKNVGNHLRDIMENPSRNCAEIYAASYKQKPAFSASSRADGGSNCGKTPHA